MTTISSPQATEYSFQYEEETSARDPTTIGDIIASAEEWDLVTLVAKAIRVEQPKPVTSRDGMKKLKLAETLFADHTGVIAVDVWEEQIPYVVTGNVYRIDDAQVRFWQGATKLTTVVNSVLKQVTDESLANVSVPERDIPLNHQETKVKIPNIHSVEKVESYYQCLNCSRRLLQVTGASKICRCDRCGYTMRSANCEVQLCAKVVVKLKDDEQPVHLTAFESALKTALKCDVICLSGEEIAEQLLLLDDLTVLYNPRSLIITEFVHN